MNLISVSNSKKAMNYEFALHLKFLCSHVKQWPFIVFVICINCIYLL